MHTYLLNHSTLQIYSAFSYNSLNGILEVESSGAEDFTIRLCALYLPSSILQKILPIIRCFPRLVWKTSKTTIVSSFHLKTIVYIFSSLNSFWVFSNTLRNNYITFFALCQSLFVFFNSLQINLKIKFNTILFIFNAKIITIIIHNCSNNR